MSGWDCPHCGADHEYGDNPDILEGLGSSSLVYFTCDCGCEFAMWVDFTPDFTIDNGSIKLPESNA